MRAACNREGVYLPYHLTLYDRLRLYEVIDYKHITVAEKKQIINDITNLQYEVDKSLRARELTKSIVLGLSVGLATAFAVKTFA